MSDSDSDGTTTKELQKQGRRLKITSKGEFKCLTCDDKFTLKSAAYKHTRNCFGTYQKNGVQYVKTIIDNSLICKWCGLKFANRGNLTIHSVHIHGDTSYKSTTSPASQTFPCNACNKSFRFDKHLRYHIRHVHFNLRASVPYAEDTQVNQVWFEKVLNSNKIVEIKKTGQSKLVIRTLNENAGVKVNTVKRRIIDLSHLYPTLTTSRVNCEYCKKSYMRRDIKKHIQEIHLNVIKHSCNNCNRSFKRAYQYLQHRCDVKRKVRINGVKHDKHSEFRVARIESLSVPLGPQV